jgi:DHA1 family tetracycline resistance protein-like MFS transporter
LTSRNALTFIFLTMLIDTIGLGLIIPVAPGLIAELTHTDLSGAAIWGGWLFFVYALMQFLCAPVIGNLSDRFGRRPVLILSLVMLAFDYVLTGLSPNIVWLFIGRTLSGMAGAAYTTANAYIADVSPPEKRAANFGIVGAAFGLGFILGPALGGLLGEYFGLRVPFFVAGGLAAANALFGYFVLTESLPLERRRAFDWRRANPLGALKALKRYPALISMFGAFALMRLAHDSLPATWTYYTMLKFGWTTGDVGLSLVAVGVLSTISYAVLPRFLTPWLGETKCVVLGLLAGALGYAGYAIAPNPAVLYAVMVVFCFSGVAGAAFNAIVSHMVPNNEQGELQGAIASLGSVTAIAAPLIMTGLFATFTAAQAPVYFPGAPFLAAAICELGALAIFAAAMARKAKTVEPVT